jgi:tetratricopeptide (TPR) repeat protein
MRYSVGNPIARSPTLFILLTALMLVGCVSNRAPTSLTSLSRSPSPAKSTVFLTPSPTRPLTVDPAPTAAARSAAAKARELGLEYQDQGRYEDAIATFQKSVSLDPQNVTGYVILGWTQHLVGQEIAATQTLKQALAIDPKHVPALNALGIVYLVQGDLQTAIATHTLAAQLKPKNEIAYYNLSLAYHRLKQYDQAIENAEIATHLEPENPHPWVALAIGQWGKGNPAAAQAAFREAINIDAGYTDAGELSYLKQAGFSLEQIQVTQKILAEMPPI